MTKPRRIVTDSMIGLNMPDCIRLSERVVRVLAGNPSPMSGPGTNTYIVGTGRRPLLLDTGAGVEIYTKLLTQALAEHCATSALDRILVTHAHLDHIGGVRQVQARFGNLKVYKMPWDGHDSAAGCPIEPLRDGAIVEADGATLRAIYTPGHAPDHLCYYLAEERALFSGDVVLGAGTTVIPDETGDLCQYLESLHRILELDPEKIYPAHGPVISNPREKINEYIAHRELRERQVLDALSDGPLEVSSIVERLYTDVPDYLHPIAANSVRAHLKKLAAEGRVVEHEQLWALA